MSPPEFSIICRTHGGPVTNVQWFPPEMKESQLIINTSQNSTYENRLTVKGRYNGKCYCTINNNIQDYFPTARNLVQQSIQIIGMTIIIVYGIMCLLICIVAGEPTNLIAESNSTHVTVSWKSPRGRVTGYVIYYQSEGGGNSSDIVYRKRTESHSLKCGVYNISIVALSLHLPSRMVAFDFSSCNVISITSTPPISTMASTSIITNIATTSISTTMMNTTITAAVKTSLIVTTTQNVSFNSPTSTVSFSSMTSISSSIEYYSSQITTTSTEATLSHTTLLASTTSIRDTSLITSYHKQPFVSPSKYYVICFSNNLCVDIIICSDQIPYSKNETSTTIIIGKMLFCY